ncbi:syntaxin-16-like protein, partial [Dinothrombium tinctorium]
ADCDEEKVNLINNGEAKFERDDSDASDGPPSWLQLLNEFRFEANNIKKKISQLREVQESLLRSTLTASSIFENDSDNNANKEKEKEIDLRSQEISRLITQLHSLLVEIKTLRSLNPTSKIIANILLFANKEICDLSQNYRQSQRQYVNKLQSREKFSQQFIINIDDCMDSSFDEFNNEKLIETEEPKTLFKQTFVDAFDDKILKEREREISVILKSINELNQIFQDINTTVVNQGTLLDRIDFNIENVQSQVEEGVIQLSKAEKSLSCKISP